MIKINYINRLPHIAPVGAEFFITFRLADALPLSVVYTLKDELDLRVQKLEREKPKNFKFQIYKLKQAFFHKYDQQLDCKPFGNCYLKNENVAQVIADRMHKFDDELYKLEAFTIMPNHVHLLIDTSLQIKNINNELDEENLENYVQLDKIMQFIKGGSAIEANRILGRKGTFWMKDSYDHYVRDANDWEGIIEYIINNPVKAGFAEHWRDWKFTYCKYL